MPLTTEQMDQIVNNHFGYEATDDVEGVLSTLTDDARHEVIPSPVGELTDRNQQRAFYKMLFSDLKGEGVNPSAGSMAKTSSSTKPSGMEELKMAGNSCWMAKAGL